MNTTVDVANSSQSYLAFIWRNESNKQYLLVGLALCIAQFVVFKILYPFPDFFNDSYWYIWAAVEKMDISAWPIGYSKFLAAFHVLTKSDTALVAFQFFFMQLAALHFYFTILYFFKTSRWSRNILFIFLFCNPLTLYLCNTVATDAIFGALTLFWFTDLLWILQRPRLQQLFIQAVLIFLCFTLRNTTYYYPFITAIIFLLSSQNVWRKLVGIVLPVLLLIPFILHTQNAAYKFTGTRQFSLFTGWQLANNALYIYGYITEDSMQLQTAEARELNRMAIKFFKSPDYIENINYIQSFAGNYYIVAAKSPIKEYFLLHRKVANNTDIIKEWGRISPSFEAFGKSVIWHHPLEYVRYFVLPNIKFYFIPPLSDIEHYNRGNNQIAHLISVWFHFPSDNVDCISNELQGFLVFYKIVFLLLNIYFGVQLILVVQKIGFVQFLKNEHYLYLLATAYLLTNFIFSIVVTMNILRYQYIPMYVLLSIGLLTQYHRDPY